MTQPIADRITRLKESLNQLKAREAAHQARIKHSQSRKAQRDSTRRKLLIGTLLEYLATQDKDIDRWLIDELDHSLTRSADRALFNLPPLDSSG